MISPVYIYPCYHFIVNWDCIPILPNFFLPRTQTHTFVNTLYVTNGYKVDGPLRSWYLTVLQCVIFIQLELFFPVIVYLFSFCTILTWSNNLVFSYWMVSVSDCTSDSHFLCSLDEYSIACFWLWNFSPDHIFQFDSHHDLWLQQPYPLMPWPSLLTIAWFIPPYFISRVCCFLLESFLFSSETLGVLFWHVFLLVTHHCRQHFFW